MLFRVASHRFFLSVPSMKTGTIAAIATPPGQGAIALIRVSGQRSVEIVEKIFHRKATGNWKPRYQHYGEIIEPGTVTKIDEVLLTWFPAPHSFTGEDVVEIGCHGGVIVTKAIVDALFQSGAEPAEPGEFSQRAFLNGKIDLTQAEAIMDLIAAKTDLAMKAASQQLEGRLGRELESLRVELISLIARVEAWIDFPEDDIDTGSENALLTQLDGIAVQIDRFLATAEQGRFLREGIRTVIAGPPNAGKSSLLNLLLGFDRAIVNEKAGTTRDTIEEVVNIGGFPVRLIDTAGIRDSTDSIEQEGIQRSQNQIENAELILLVIDSSESSASLRAIEFPEGTRTLTILNKSDLPMHSDWSGNMENSVSLSCLSEVGTADLTTAISEILSGKSGIFDSANTIAINARHQHCLLSAKSELARARKKIAATESPEFAAMDLRSALEAIGEIIGKTDVEEILGEIFSKFCIGK